MMWRAISVSIPSIWCEPISKSLSHDWFDSLTMIPMCPFTQVVPCVHIAFFSERFWFGITCPLSSHRKGMYTLDGFLRLSIQVFWVVAGWRFFIDVLTWHGQSRTFESSPLTNLCSFCTQKCVNEPTKRSGYVQLETSHCDWEASLGLVLFQISHLSPCLICFVQQVRHVRGVRPILFSCPSSGCSLLSFAASCF